MYEGSYGIGKEVWPMYCLGGESGKGNGVIVLEGEKCVSTFTSLTNLQSFTLLSCYSYNSSRIKESLQNTKELENVFKFLYITDNDTPGYSKGIKFTKTLWELGYESSMIEIKNLASFYNTEINESEDIVEFLERYQNKHAEIRFLKLLSQYINR